MFIFPSVKMSSASKVTVFVIVALCVVYGAVQVMSQCEETRNGCRILNGQCHCGTGCYSEYRFKDKNDCYKALRRKVPDVCNRNPCKNGGACSQISQQPGYRCQCEGTGYYGQKCQFQCPKSGFLQGPFPYECIQI